MSSYTVVQADHKKDFNGNRGPMSIYSLVLNDEKGQTETCELCQMTKTAPPQAGQTLEGHIEPNRNPEYAPSFKKDYSGSGGFSGGPGGASRSASTFKARDPSEIAGARHAHNLLVAAHSFTPLPADPNLYPTMIQQRIDDLEAFACVLDEKTAAISAAAMGESAIKNEASKADSDVPF